MSYAIGGHSNMKWNQKIQYVQQLIGHVNLADSVASAAAATARISADSVAAIRHSDLNDRNQRQTFQHESFAHCWE